MTEDAIWVVEVNPRYTASVEVLELACDANLMPLHVRACQHGELPADWSIQPHRRVGKAIVFAEKDGRVPTDFDQFVRCVNSHQARPAVADIPAVGREFRRGEPLVTVLAEGGSLSEVEQSLRQTGRPGPSQPGLRLTPPPVEMTNVCLRSFLVRGGKLH